MQPLFSVIIVNYNTADLLPGCLESVITQNMESCEIIVIDNASCDESVDIICSRCYPDVQLVANRENIGFARACNQGLKLSLADLVFFLNPDTVVQPGCFREAYSFMAGHPEIGLAGTAILDPDLRPHPSVEYSYPGHHYVADELDNLPGGIAWLLGASLVGRARLLKEIGGFDEDFFLYGEDIDLGLRVRKAGWSLGYIPDARIVHLEGQSERGSRPAEVFARKIRAELLFFDHHYRETTIRRIVRARLVQACWCVLTQRLTQPLVRDGKRASEKLKKYQVTRQLYGQYLRDMNR